MTTEAKPPPYELALKLIEKHALSTADTHLCRQTLVTSEKPSTLQVGARPPMDKNLLYATYILTLAEVYSEICRRFSISEPRVEDLQLWIGLHGLPSFETWLSSTLAKEASQC